jgi:hypothetical protein
MAESIEGVIYAEAQRGLALQAVLLNELRSRTGILLAITAATNSFLGAEAIDRGGLQAWGVLALAAFVAAVGCCLLVLSPHYEWVFYEGPAKMLGMFCDTPRDDGESWTLDQVHREVALHMEDDADAAANGMKGLQKWFTGAAAGLALSVTFWLIEYGT